MTLNVANSVKRYVLVHRTEPATNLLSARTRGRANQPSHTSLQPGDSGFNSGLSRKLDAEWHLPQEDATLYDLKRLAGESKLLRLDVVTLQNLMQA